MRFDPALPFALVRDDAASAFRLFTGFAGALCAEGHAPVRAAIAALAAPGQWLAGGISYEAGHALEPRLGALPPGWLWFGRFTDMQLLDDDAAMALLPGRAEPEAAQPRITREAFARMVARTQALIAAGDLYQANLTFQADVRFSGHPAALFRRLWQAGRPPMAALIHRGDGRWWLSLSPELFFRMRQGLATARPMKGTAPRGESADADAARAAALAADPKNRAENLMITDLIRHDLSRLAIPGSVRVPHPFTVEPYPSLHQLTSTVEAKLRPGTTVADMLGALFPCGSITGAPKIRAMEVIAAEEAGQRGLYCGSIGWIARCRSEAAFNVAIRTLECGQPGHASLGLGAGIVADSVAEDEWRECLLKARFLGQRAPATLLETMRRTADGIPRLSLHLARLEASARRFGFPFRRSLIAERLAALPPPAADERLRLMLSARGQVAVSADPAPPPRSEPIRFAIRPLPVPASDWRLFHKSSDRGFYDDARRTSGAEEVVFVDAQGQLTEGSFTSLFIERGGRLLTPPAALGLLPGVLRAELLGNGMAEEAVLTEADVRGGCFLGNSLRGLMPAVLAEAAAAA